MGNGAVPESLVCFCSIDAENLFATPLSFSTLVATNPAASPGTCV